MCTDMSENGHFLLVLGFEVLLTISLCHTNVIDVRFIIGDKEKYCVAAGRDIQSIMMWGYTSTVSYFEPNLESRGINCEFRAYEDCTMYWSKNGWAARNSLEFELGPILDRRWEGLPSHDGTLLERHYYKIKNGTRFEIPVSIRSIVESHLFLCDGASGSSSNCYWIHIGDQTAMRKCKSNQIPSDNYELDEPSECKDIHISKTHGQIFALLKWNHISVKKVGKKISVNLSNGTELLEWVDEKDNINVSQFTIRMAYGQFKVHAYDLIYTTKQELVQMGNFTVYFELEQNIFCVAIFVRMCKKCTMVVFLQDTVSGEQLGKEKTFTSNGVWEEVYFSVNISAYRKSAHKGFYIKTIAEENTIDPFWAIGEIRACSSRDIRFIKYDGFGADFCTIVRSNEPNEIMRIYSITANKSDASERCKDYSLRIGNKCYSSNKISIERSRICYYEKHQKQSVCYCSPGYEGYRCYEECAGKYGYDCEKICGNCNNNTCNNVNGHCSGECEDNSFFPTCKIVPQSPINTTITFDDDDNLIASWMQSDRAEGPVEEIIIALENQQGDTLYNANYNDDFEKPDFSKQIDRPKNGWNKDLVNASFKACNNLLCSEAVSVKITLPPAVPIFHGEVSIELSGNSAIIKLPQLSNYKKIFILLSNPNLPSNVEQQTPDKLHLKCNISLPHTVWLLSTILKLANGDGIRLHVEPDTEYEVCIVLLNENSEHQRFSARKMKFNSPPETTTIHYYIWPVLLLVLLILAVILLIYMRKKKRNHATRKELHTYEELAFSSLQENNTYEEPIVSRTEDENVYEVPNYTGEHGAQGDIENQYDLVVSFLKTNIVADNAESKYLSVQDFDYKYNLLLNLLERAEPVYANFQTKYEESAPLDDAISRLRICLSDVKDRLMQAKKEFEGIGPYRDNGGNQDLLKSHLQRELKEIYERIRDLNLTTNSHKQ